MKSRLSIPSFIFYGLTGIIIIIMAASFLKALSFLNKPFPGSLLYQSPYVGSINSSDWPGKKAGLKYLDRIIRVDERPVWEGEDVIGAVKSMVPRTPVLYFGESKAKMGEVT